MKRDNFIMKASCVVLLLTFIVLSTVIIYSLPDDEGFIGRAGAILMRNRTGEVMLGEHRYHQFLDHQGHVNALVHDPNCQCFGGK